MYVIKDLDSGRMMESSEEIQLNVMSDKEFKKWKEIFGDPFKSGEVPIGSLTYHLVVGPIRFLWKRCIQNES